MVDDTEVQQEKALGFLKRLIHFVNFLLRGRSGSHPLMSRLPLSDAVIFLVG